MTCEYFQDQLALIKDGTVAQSAVVTLIDSEMERLIRNFSGLVNKSADRIKSQNPLQLSVVIRHAVTPIQTGTVASLANLKQPAINGVTDFFNGHSEGIDRESVVAQFQNVCKENALHMWTLAASAVKKMKSSVPGSVPSHPLAITQITFDVHGIEQYFQLNRIQPFLWQPAVKEGTIDRLVTAFFEKMSKVLTAARDAVQRVQSPAQAGKLIEDMHARYRKHEITGMSISLQSFMDSISVAGNAGQSAAKKAEPSAQEQVKQCLRGKQNAVGIASCFSTQIDSITELKVYVDSISEPMDLMLFELSTLQ